MNLLRLFSKPESNYEPDNYPNFFLDIDTRNLIWEKGLIFFFEPRPYST